MISIPAARAALIDKTGSTNREWYQFFFNISFLLSNNVKFTPEGGLAVKYINKTGAASIKGYVVGISDTTDDAVRLVVIGSADPIGVFYEDGAPDGEYAWVVVAGKAYVYFAGSTTRGHLARVWISAEAGAVSGQATSEAYPTSPLATDKHFCELGHIVESRTGAGLAKCNLHFN